MIDSPFFHSRRDLLQRAKGFLHQRGYVHHHRTLELSVERGVVVVQGQVPTFYLRQVAVECIKHVAGAVQVVDLIRVVHSPVQPRATASPVVEQGSSALSMRYHADVPDTAGTAEDTPRSHF